MKFQSHNTFDLEIVWRHQLYEKASICCEEIENVTYLSKLLNLLSDFATKAFFEVKSG